MLALSLALLRQPHLLLVDEPSLGLSPLLVQEIFEVFGRIRQTGTTLVLVEQFVHMALRLADRVFLLQKGSLVFAGRAQDLEESGGAAAELMGAYLGGAHAKRPETRDENGYRGGQAEVRESIRLELPSSYLRFLEDQAEKSGRSVATLVAESISNGNERRGGLAAVPTVSDWADLHSPGLVACGDCGHPFRAVLTKGRCPFCRSLAIEHAIEDDYGTIGRLWYRNIKNRAFLLLVISITAFLQMLVLLFLLRITD